MAGEGRAGFPGKPDISDESTLIPYTLPTSRMDRKRMAGAVLLALAYRAGGWNSVVTLIIATISLTVFLMGWFLSRWLKPILAIMLAFVAMAPSHPIFTGRHISSPSRSSSSGRRCSFVRQGKSGRHPGGSCADCVVGEPARDLHPELRHRGFRRSRSADAHRSLETGSRGEMDRIRCALSAGQPDPPLWRPGHHGTTFAVAYGNEAVSLIAEWRPFNAQDLVVRKLRC